jgi:hypothetical protein
MGIKPKLKISWNEDDLQWKTTQNKNKKNTWNEDDLQWKTTSKYLKLNISASTDLRSLGTLVFSLGIWFFLNLNVKVSLEFYLIQNFQTGGIFLIIFDLIMPNLVSSQKFRLLACLEPP